MSEAKKMCKNTCRVQDVQKKIPKQKRFQAKNVSTNEPRQDKQTNNWPIILFETEYFPLKKFLVRFESRSFAVLDVFVTSRLSEPGTLRKLNTLGNH